MPAGAGAGADRPRTGPARRLSAFLYRHEHSRLVALLSAPMLWLVVLYLGSLAVMVVSSFWSVNDFTGALVRQPTTGNYQTLLTEAIYRTVALRTLAVAAGVTLLDLIIALPVALYLGKVVRSRRARHLLVVAVTMPLWTSYLVKGYAWRIMLDRGGVLDWLLRPVGLHGPGLGMAATVLALAYLWLPYMILPIYAGLERLPDSLLEASADLGGRPARTFRRVVLPLIVPAIVAGTIFSFSLTMGDYIMVQIVGGDTQLFANIIYANIGIAGNQPLAAAAAVFPIAVVLLYLAAVRRTGALDNL